MRGVGAVEALRATLPEGAVGAAAALTHLGDPAVLVALVVVVYWRRPDAGRLLVVGLGAVGLVLALKGAFALPRPPPALRAVPADGYGFPSGHATGATAVYGGLALLSDRWPARVRAGAAAAVVAAVAISRVVIGVHYLVDVVAGVLAGGMLLAVVWWLPPHRTAAALWLAAGLAGAGAALDWSPDPALAAGVAAGAALAWTVAGDAPTAPPAVPAMAAAAAGLGAAVAVPWLLAAAPAVLAAAGVAAGAGGVVLPAVAAG